MLRGTPEIPQLAETPAPYGAAAPTNAEFPGVDQAFATDEHPPGILFYRAKQSFFLPYQLLQTMRYEGGQLKLVFAPEDVVITGHGLHRLYVQLAAHRVYRIVEQGERYAGVAEVEVHVGRIEEFLKGDED